MPPAKEGGGRSMNPVRIEILVLRTEKKAQPIAQWLDLMLLIRGTELLMGGSQVGVETSTPPLPSLQRQSPQSTCFSQLVMGRL